MKIHHMPADAARAESLRGTRAPAAEAAQKPAPHAAPHMARTDRVQISDAGRALAAQPAADGVARMPAPLTPERIATLRQQILDGAYNSLDMVDHVARSILRSGDL